MLGELEPCLLSPEFIGAPPPPDVGGGALLVGGTLSVWPAMGSGSLLKALFLLSTRSIGEPGPPSTGDFGAKSDAGPCESLVRFFFRREPRDGIGKGVLGRFTGREGYSRV